MILLVTNREDITADFVVLELQRRKEDFVRFNTEDFPEKIKLEAFFNRDGLDGYFKFLGNKRTISFSSIRSGWYRRPTLPNLSNIKLKYRKFCLQETITTLNGIWNSLNIFWVSNPKNINFAENKLIQLKMASQIGFLIPPTIISNDCKKVNLFFQKHKDNVVIKPVKTGMLADGQIVFTSFIDNKRLKYLEQSASLPSIYQENIKKDLDIRITIIGDSIFATEIHSQTNSDSMVDWRRSQDVNLLHEKHNLPRAIEDKCLILTRKLGLRFGAIDMILNKNGEYYFLEINPNGQWGWIEKRTGYKLTEALVALLIKGAKNEKDV